MTLATRQIRFTPLRWDLSGAPPLATGYYMVEPTGPYDDGSGRVEVIPVQIQINGTPAIKDLPVTPLDFSWAVKVTSHFVGQEVDPPPEYVAIPAGAPSTILDFEDLVRLDPATLGPIDSVSSAVELRLEAVEAAVAGGVGTGGAPAGTGTGGRIKVEDLENVTATGISLAESTSAVNAAGVIGAVITTTNQTVGGIKTFSSPPVVPTPSGSTDAANKSYVDGSTVVHTTTAETIAGVKTFSSSPIVPTPTTSTQAANKSYVDGVAGAGGVALGTTAGTAAEATTVVLLTGAQTKAGVLTTSSEQVIQTATATTSPLRKDQFDAYHSPCWLMINFTTGVWPSRVVPSGASMVLWWSAGYPNAVTPPAAIDGDFWAENYPT